MSFTTLGQNLTITESVVCPGATVVFDVTGYNCNQDNIQFKWRKQETNGTFTTKMITNVPTWTKTNVSIEDDGAWRVKIENGNNLCTNSNIVGLEVIDSTPSVSIAPINPNSFCENQSVFLQGQTQGGGVSSLSWSANIGGGMLSSPNSTSTTYTPPSNYVGPVTITLTAFGACANASTEIQLYVDAEPEISFIYPPATSPFAEVCQGETINLTTSTGGSTTSVLWESSISGGNFNPSPTNPSSYTLPPNHIGQINLTAIAVTPQNNECNDASISTTVIVVEGTTATAVLGSTQEVCGTGSFQLNGSINGSGVSFDSWFTIPDVGNFDPQNSLSTTYYPPANYYGDIEVYFMTTDSPNLCGEATSNPITLTVSEEASATANAEVYSLCEGEVFALHAGVGGSATWGTWQSNQGGNFNPSPTDFNPTYTPPQNYTGSILLSFTTNDPPGICPAMNADFQVDVLPFPSSTIAVADVSGNASDNIICEGDQFELNVNGGTGTTCIWSSSAELTDPTSSSSCDWVINNLTTDASFNVMVTNAAGCSSSSTVAIQVQATPLDFDIETTNPCLGENLILTPSDTNFVSYQWTLNGFDIDAASSINIPIAQEVDNGTYCYEGTDVAGCTWTQCETVDLTEKSDPILSRDHLFVCQNSQIYYRVMNPSPGENSKFLWNISPPLSDTTDLNDLLWVRWATPGMYMITVTEVLGDNIDSPCNGADTIMVEVTNSTALDTATISYYPLNNLMIVADPNAECYQWGYFDSETTNDDEIFVEIPNETFQAYAAENTFDPDLDYWVKTWNGDCSNPVCATYSIVGRRILEEPLEEKKTVVFPNPNHGSFQLEATRLSEESYSILITDILGRVIERRKINTINAAIKTTFKIETTTSGIYQLAILNPKGNVVRTQKIVIAH